MIIKFDFFFVSLYSIKSYEILRVMSKELKHMEGFLEGNEDQTSWGNREREVAKCKGVG